MSQPFTIFKASLSLRHLPYYPPAAHHYPSDLTILARSFAPFCLIIDVGKSSSFLPLRQKYISVPQILS
jgi:hypothetical protein